MNTLILEKRGCNFMGGDGALSDIGNYRVCTRKEEVEGKDGNVYSLEFCLWENKSHYKYLSKSGKLLKNPCYVLDNKNGLAVKLQFTDKDGARGNVGLEREIDALNLAYTKKDILKAVNYISKNKYDNIELLEIFKK